MIGSRSGSRDFGSQKSRRSEQNGANHDSIQALHISHRGSRLLRSGREPRSPTMRLKRGGRRRQRQSMNRQITAPNGSPRNARRTQCGPSQSLNAMLSIIPSAHQSGSVLLLRPPCDRFHWRMNIQNAWVLGRSVRSAARVHVGTARARRKLLSNEQPRQRWPRFARLEQE